MSTPTSGNVPAVSVVKGITLSRGKELTPTKSVAPLTGAPIMDTMTADENPYECSIPATKVASPRLALTGEVALRLPSVFIRTVRVPVESRMKTVPTIGVVDTCIQDWRGVRSLVRPQGDTQTRTDDADATVSPVNPSYSWGYGGRVCLGSGLPVGVPSTGGK